MIYLDTNAFYYAAGISSGECDVEKVRSTISNNHVAISSVSLYEFAMRFRNNIEVIHKGGKFLGDNHILVGFNKYFPVPNYLPEYLANITSKELENFITGIIDTKIDVEGRFAGICFSTCFISIANFMVETSSPNGSTNDFYLKLFRTIMKMMSEVNTNNFKSLFEAGYSTDNCENYVRKCFDNYMEFYLQCFVPCLIKASEVDSYDEYIELEKTIDWNALSEKISNKIRKEDTTMKFVRKQATAYWKQLSDDHLINFLSKLRISVNKCIREETLQEYITDIIRGFLIEGASFWKNDILDAIIISHLTDEDKIVTFDNGAIEHIKKYSIDRPLYQNSIDLISELMLS